MTLGRALSLAAVVALLIGVATGLSHVGHSTTSTCKGDTWVVVARGEPSPSGASADNTRAARTAAPHPLSCPGSARDPKGGWLAYYLFASPQDAQAYVNALIAAGYVEQSAGFTPYVRPAPASQ
jgi:hypothetical protein